ncbi:type IX secretion system sortase PorU [Flavicella sp.]|uniref:type IX secretion system sortase PorU n=1 Tax=Flavicella sp. TaxID=2957742 RepID=UPI003017948A
MDAEIEISNGVKFSVPLVENNFLDANENPLFQSYWDIGTGYNKVSYRLKNIVFENVGESYQNLFNLEFVSEDVVSSLEISRSPSAYGVTLMVFPLVKEGKTVRKIVSFDIEYQLFSVSTKSLKTSSTNNSVLQTGNWYKFSIDKTGIFKLDKSFIESLGLSVSDIDPKDIRIYGNGGGMLPNLNSDFRYDDLQENAIYVNGEDDNSFNDDDFVLFYGKGAHDWLVSDESEISHRQNIYSEEAYYFLNVDIGRGKRISEAAEVVSPATDLITTYKDYIVYEDDLVNLIGAGQQWFGDSFSVTNNRDYNFNFENIDVSKQIKIKVRGASTSNIATNMLVSVDDTEVLTLSYSSITDSQMARAAVNSVEVVAKGPNIDVNIIYNNNGNPASDAFLDYIEIIGGKLLIASGSQFLFRNFISQQNSRILEYSISNLSNIDMVWDVTNSIEPKLITNQSSGENFVFKANSGILGEYAVLNDTDYYLPKLISNGPIGNQNLHGLKDIQYLLITNENLSSQAQRLADYHSTNSDLSTKVVSLKEIYNEFGSGSPDITAIRDFVKYLYDNASSEDFKIKYLCLFGDSSYDYKDRIANNNNIVPVYLAYSSFSLSSSYVTDDYYGMMDENEGGMTSANKQDVATGRILVSDNTEAAIVVDKILAYYDSSSYGSWRNSIVFVSDDMEDASEFDFQVDLDAIAESIKEEKPQYNIKKIYADSYVQVQTEGGSRYPDVNTAISNSMDSGTLLFNYFGHGNEIGLSHKRILSLDDIDSWVNFNKSPLFITITCDFTRFDNPATFTAGEEIIISSKGGSASLISTTREVYVDYGKRFNKALIPNVLGLQGSVLSSAEALMNSKNEAQLSDNQRFFIFYFGDPAMKLGVAEPMIKVTHINDKDILVYRDTLKSLSKIKISGEVQDEDGNLLNDFNGELSTIIYDKPTFKSTLNNDDLYDGDGNPYIFTFETQESSIFKGKANVENGLFSFEFVVPKDVKLAYGTSKISLYFNNLSDSKTGYDLETILGGINESPDPDDEGPEIELFMEDTSFLDGGNTSENPVLIAYFSDKSGINTSTGGIGHSITAVIDGDEGNPIELNEFYESESGDFTKGEVNYTLRNLTAGPHTLKLKVWDTYNNASDKTLSFTVTESSEFVLENVLNYPNPFIDYTEFWFTHNQPNELLDVKIYVYTVSGKLVKSIREVVQTSGSLSRTINWNGKDDFGGRVGKGVYVYKIEVTNISSGVRAEKFEKLVLLQ